jgi:hypothetical protein
MVKIRIPAVATICAILALATIMPQRSAVTVASAATVPEIGPGFVLPGSDTAAADAGKYPSVVGVGSTVHMVANTNQSAMYWSKQDTTSTVANPINFGGTDGDTDYTEAAIAAAPDGTVYAVWIVQSSGINMKRKPVGGDWEATKSIYRTGSFMAYIDIAVSSSGQIFVIWNQDNYYRFTTSTNGSNTWSGAGVVSSKKPYKSVFVAAGANNSAVVAFGSGDGNAYAAVWNGSSFDSANLTPFKVSGDFFASAKPVIAPNGKIYIAFRNAGGGLYYTERQTDGSWPVSKLASGQIYDAIGVGADTGSNLHFAWSSNVSGSWQLYYAFKPVDGDWQGPVKAPGISDKIVSDVDLSTTIGTRNYGHAVFETFNGSGAALRYQQFSSLGGGTLSATPVLDGGAVATRNNVVTVSFSNVIGAPDGVRYHWDAAPTDADAWATFANPLSLPGPAGVTPDACQTHILYTQVRKGTVSGSTAQASEIFDTGVQANVTILNRHLAGLSPIYDLSTSDVFTGPGGNGASDGDPYYTREASFDLGISGQADCSGLKTYSIPGSESGTITNNSRHRAPALPGASAPGPHDVSVGVTDTLGNTKTWQKTLIYDPADDPSTTITDTTGLPVLASGGSVTADTANSIIRSLSFKNISVDDNLYGQQANLPQLAAGKQFWGVWIANTTSPTTTVDDSSLNWYPVHVPTPNSSFTVTWDLFSGLGFTADLRNRPGDYYVFVRFLDGAGNPSTNSIKTKVTLTAGYDIPTVRLPALAR